MGPNVATPELFAEALFTDTSSWTVIDRGPFEALLPITVSREQGSSPRVNVVCVVADGRYPWIMSRGVFCGPSLPAGTMSDMFRLFSRHFV